VTTIPPRLSRVAALALALVGSAFLVARPLEAQIIDEGPDVLGGPDENAAAAYLALTMTPVGALAPSADYMLARPGTGPRPLRLHGRFASLDRGVGIGQRAWAATIDMPVASASLSLTGGYVDITCDDELDDPSAGISVNCQGGVMFGARLGSSFFSRSLDAAGTSVLVLGAEVTGGYSDVKIVEGEIFGVPLDVGGTAMTASVALPAALNVRSGEVSVSPIVAPRLAWGRAKAEGASVDATIDDTRADIRFMLGAGVAVRLGARVGFEAGLQKVFVEDGDTAYGLGVSVAF
jgi:hypothetical protein